MLREKSQKECSRFTVSLNVFLHLSGEGRGVGTNVRCNSFLITYNINEVYKYFYGHINPKVPVTVYVGNGKRCILVYLKTLLYCPFKLIW